MLENIDKRKLLIIIIIIIAISLIGYIFYLVFKSEPVIIPPDSGNLPIGNLSGPILSLLIVGGILLSRQIRLLVIFRT